MGGLPDRWLIDTVEPPTDTVPTRTSPVVFAATRTMTVPWPVPDAPFGNANQAAPADAVHAHPDVVVIAMDWSPPLAFTFTLAGRTVTLQAAAA